MAAKRRRKRKGGEEGSTIGSAGVTTGGVSGAQGSGGSDSGESNVKMVGVVGLLVILAVAIFSGVLKPSKINIFTGDIEFVDGTLSKSEMEQVAANAKDRNVTPPAAPALTPVDVERLVPIAELKRYATNRPLPPLSTSPTPPPTLTGLRPTAAPVLTGLRPPTANPTTAAPVLTGLRPPTAAPTAEGQPNVGSLLRPIDLRFAGSWKPGIGATRYQIEVTSAGCSFKELIRLAENGTPIVTAQGSGVQVGGVLFVAYNASFGKKGSARLSLDASGTTLTVALTTEKQTRTLTLTRDVS